MVSRVEYEPLRQLQRQLNHLDLGDRSITGRLELFSLVKPEKGSNLLHSVDDLVTPANPRQYSVNSNVGPLSAVANRHLMIHLIQAIGYAYPE